MGLLHGKDPQRISMKVRFITAGFDQHHQEGKRELV